MSGSKTSRGGSEFFGIKSAVPPMRSVARVGRVVSAAAAGSPFLSPLAQLRLSSTPALVARAQGGLTLSLEEGELDADLYYLGNGRPYQTSVQV